MDRVPCSTVDYPEGNTTETVADLAADHVRRNRFPAIPTWVLLLVLMTASIAAIVVPMATIFLSNSNDSINDLSAITLRLAAIEASQAVEGVISAATQMLEGLVTSPYFAKDFLASAANINASRTVFPALLKSLATGFYATSIECSTMGTPAFGPMGAYLNRTDVQAAITAPQSDQDRTPIVIYNDPSTNGALWLETLAFHNYSSHVSSVGIGPAPLTNPDIALTQQNNRSVTPYFETTYLSVGAYAFWHMSYYRNVWLNPADAGSVSPDLTCFIGLVLDKSLSVLLDSVRVTNNTVVLLMDTKGLLLATNRNGSISTPQNISVRVAPDGSPDPHVSLVGRGLLSVFGSYASIPHTSSSSSQPPSTPSSLVYQRTFDDGHPWFLTTTILDISGTPFTFVVAFPRADMFAKMDEAERRGIVVASAVAAAGLLCTALITFLALRPVGAMAKNMTQLTKFDFSLLEKGVLDKRSLLSEIREAETAFDTMVKAFAGAIRRNKQLIDNRKDTSSGGKHPTLASRTQAPSTMASSVVGGGVNGSDAWLT